jgi:putative toxin-antitoxin system antitoxin component (TIGR02293 family)
MKKQEIAKSSGSKKVTIRHLVTKNEVAKGRRVKIKVAQNLIAKQVVSEPFTKDYVVQGRKSSNVKIIKDDHLKLEQLNIALQTYAMNSEIDSPDFMHESGISFTDFLSDKLILVKLIRKGIPYSIFKLILNITPFSLNDWADYLDISVKSLIRYQQQDKTFRPGQSEKIIELAEVNNLGLEVFGNNVKFRRWLETPNYSLGNLKPFDLLKDSYGKEMIMGELTRIEYGILV